METQAPRGTQTQAAHDASPGSSDGGGPVHLGLPSTGRQSAAAYACALVPGSAQAPSGSQSTPKAAASAPSSWQHCSASSESKRRTSGCPRSAAKCSAVHPSASRASGDTPARQRPRRHSARPRCLTGPQAAARRRDDREPSTRKTGNQAPRRQGSQHPEDREPSIRKTGRPVGRSAAVKRRNQAVAA